MISKKSDLYKHVREHFFDGLRSALITTTVVFNESGSPPSPSSPARSDLENSPRSPSPRRPAAPSKPSSSEDTPPPCAITLRELKEVLYNNWRKVCYNGFQSLRPIKPMRKICTSLQNSVWFGQCSYSRIWFVLGNHKTLLYRNHERDVFPVLVLMMVQRQQVSRLDYKIVVTSD